MGIQNVFPWSRLFVLIGQFAYKIKKPSRWDAHCGINGRSRDAAAAGAGFASETLF